MTKAIWFFIALFLACSLFAAPGRARKARPETAIQSTFYIAPDGNDGSGDGTAAHPWHSLPRAQAYIRDHGVNRNMTGDIVVYVRAGKYYVDRPMEFSPLDSGSNGFQVVYRNQDELGSAEFIGGEAVVNWVPYAGEVYKAFVGAGRRFHTMYENGERARLGRFPRAASNGIYANSQAPYLMSEGVEGSRTVLQYRPEDFDPAAWDLSRAQVYIWSGGEHDWFSDLVPIADVDPVAHRLLLAQETRYPIALDGSGSRYYLQGITLRPPARAASAAATKGRDAVADARRTRGVTPLLNGPGEFYLDEARGELYYWPRNADIARQSIVIPRVRTLLSLVGASERERVHHLQFEGLTFACTDFTDWYRFGWVRAGESGEDHSYPEFDRQIELPPNRTGMAYLENTDHVTFRYDRFLGAGFSAIYLLYYNQYDTIYGSLFERMGYNAVTIQGRYPGEGDVSRFNLISNNDMHRLGELVGHASGVEITNSGSNEVSYNMIHDSPRYAVQWRARPYLPKDAIYLRDNLFRYLKIYNCGQDSGDAAPLYGYGISNESPYLVNTVEQVTVDDTYAHPSVRDLPPNGVFMDNCSYGQIFRNVRVVNAQGGLFRDNESGNHGFSNVNWRDGFQDSLMDYKNIGVKRDFPYPGTH